MSRVSLLKFVRLFHLYSGVFLAPALLFFAFTGFLQSFSFHETTRGSSYKPPAILVRLGQLHKKQTLVVPANRLRPADKPPEKLTDKPIDRPVPPDGADASSRATRRGMDAKPGLAATAAPGATTATPARVHNLWPMKIFFGICSVGLAFLTLSGLFMSYSFARNKKLVSAALVAGVAVPLLLLLF